MSKLSKLFGLLFESSYITERKLTEKKCNNSILFIGSYDFIGINNYGSVYVSASTSSGTASSPSMTTDAGVTVSGVSVTKHIIHFYLQ